MPGQTNPLSPGAAAAAPAPPPTRREIERKLSMRSASTSVAEPPRPGPRRRSSNPLSPASYTGGNESDSSFQSSIGATSPITPVPIHSLNANPTSTTTTTGPATIPQATPSTTTMTTQTPTSNLIIPPKGTSVLSSIRERGENDTTTIFSDRDIEEEDELDEEEDEEGEEDEVGGGMIGSNGGAGVGGNAGGTGPGGVLLELPDGQRRVDGEELKRGMEGERMVKSGYLLKKGEKRKNWKKRWFVLRTEKLAYYRDEKEYMLCQILSLREIHSVVSVQLKKHSHAFGIITAKRTFYVRAGSQQEVEGWIHAINDARRNLAESDERARDGGGGMGEGERGAAMAMSPGSSQPVQSSIPIPNKSGGLGLGVGGASGTSTTGLSYPSEGFGQYGVSPGYTEMSLGSYTPQRAGSISHSLSNSMYGSQPQPAGGVPIPGIESQLDKLGLGDHYQGQHQPGGSGYTSGMTTPTVSDRARMMTGGFEPPTPGGTTRKRDRSAGSISSIPLEGGPYIPGGPGPSLLPQAFLPTSSDEEDDAFIPRSSSGLAQQNQNQNQNPTQSHIAGMMAMSPTTHMSSPMGHPPVPPSSSSSSYPHAQQGYAVPGPIQTDPKKVILNGYLMKLGTRGKKTWRKRWFVLTSGELVYTKSHMDTKVHRQIPLSSILDAIDLEPLSPSGSETSDSEDAGGGGGGDYHLRSPTSPRKARVVAQGNRDRARTRTRGIAMGSGGGVGPGGVSAGAGGSGGERTSGMGKHHHHQHHHQPAIRHAFQVITPQRTFKLCAPSEEEEIKWVAALRALINRERGLLSPVMGIGGGGMSLPVGGGAGMGGVGGGGYTPRVASQLPATPGVYSGMQGQAQAQGQGQGQGQGQVQGEDVSSYFPLGQPLPSGPTNTSTSTNATTTTTSINHHNNPTLTPSTRPPRASPSHLPPLITTPLSSSHGPAPTHHRTRSATQSAKAAVAEVVRRFNPEGGGASG